MLKVSNQTVITDLAKTTYKANKKKNFMLIVAIFLTTFLIASVLLFGTGYYRAITLRQRWMSGMDYDIQLTEPRPDQEATLRKMDQIKYIGLNVKCVILQKYKDKNLDKVRIFYEDKTCYEKQMLPALAEHKGAYPVKENEIMLSNAALKAMGIKHPKIGMKLPLTFQSMAEDRQGEETKDFYLSGFFKDYTGEKNGYISKKFFDETGVKQTDLTQGTLKISLKNPLYNKSDLLQIQKELKLNDNQVLEGDEYAILVFVRLMAGLLMFLLLVFLSGYLFIYNVQYISMNKEIGYFGQLKTLGTTSEQLRKLVNLQLLWNAAIGILAGVALASVLENKMIEICLKQICKEHPVQGGSFETVLTLLIAVAFSGATAYLGSRKPRKIVEDTSPIEAVKYTGLLKSERKGSRISRGGSVFSMALLNLFRDKKQFVIIVLSLSAAVALYLVVNSVILTGDAKYILNQTSDDDAEILNLTLLEDNELEACNPELIKEIRDLPGVSDVRTLTGTTAFVPYQNVYKEFYRTLYNGRYSPGNYKTDMKEYKSDPKMDRFTCRVIGVDDSEFEKLNKTVAQPLDKKDFIEGKVCFYSLSLVDGDCGITGKMVKFGFPGVDNGQLHIIQLGAMLDDNPGYYSAGYSPDLIVSQKFVRKLLGDKALTEMVKVDCKTSFDKATEKSIKRIVGENKYLSMDSKLASYMEIKKSEDKIRLLGNSIAVLIMALAILNFINMMSSGLESRRVEFAILESVGMTRGQIRTMIAYESLDYSLFACLLASIIGFPCAYLAFEGFKEYEIPFAVPVFQDVIVFIAIFLVCFASGQLIFKKMHQMSVIELLRNNY